MRLAFPCWPRTSGRHLINCRQLTPKPWEHPRWESRALEVGQELALLPCP